ncbi:TetR family transcriptional regulator [Streptomyces sp. MPA0124]|uniref:TetR family transcriptional regulator n=1 Tax=Streptomyces sp. MPA0124 TaxID=3378069 RepID=UPI003853F6C4
MEQVTEAAPVSQRTLYAHFRTKNDLVIAHLQDLVGSGATLEAVLTRADLAPPVSGSADCSASGRPRRLGCVGVPSSTPPRSSPTRRARCIPTPRSRSRAWCS